MGEDALAPIGDSVISSPYLLCTAPTPSSSGIPVISKYEAIMATVLTYSAHACP